VPAAREATRARAPINRYPKSFKGFVCTMSDKDFAKLRISRAYFNLMCLPEGDARKISLAWIGNYEIRMLEPSSTSCDDAPLFLIELFDHDAGSTVDLCVCHAIEERTRSRLLFRGNMSKRAFCAGNEGRTVERPFLTIQPVAAPEVSRIRRLSRRCATRTDIATIDLSPGKSVYDAHAVEGASSDVKAFRPFSKPRL